ncbi:MAG: hypothetical protein LBB29_01500 [Holosporaceae bacterium]|nr:hypothetical protein [Holosporaceae bacterium]
MQNFDENGQIKADTAITIERHICAAVLIFLFGTSCETSPKKNDPAVCTVVFDLSPIGDNTNCEVYGFIMDYIISQNKETRDVQKLVQQELEDMNKPNMKSYMGDIVETETSHLLYALCTAKPWCRQITIYAKDGVVIASGGIGRDIVFHKDPEDVYESLGFLYSASVPRLKIKKIIDSKTDTVYLKITRVIYYNQKQNYAYFLAAQENPTDELIGYISYVIRSVD